MHGRQELTPEVLIRAYASGVFPMAESRQDPTIYWIDPKERGILPLDAFHVPRTLRKTVRRKPFDIRTDSAFARVIKHCSMARTETWINDEILRAYTDLHHLGYAHSVEAWEEGELVGGLYGVSLGGAFFGESMFSYRTDASKVALVHLVARLRIGNFALLDTQFVTEHLKRFGAVEVPARNYLNLLSEALSAQAVFYRDSEVSPAAEESALEELFRQSSTQMS